MQASMWRRVLILLLTGMVGVWALPALAEESSHERFGVLQGSDMGYLGCVYEVDDPARSHCFAAYVLTDGSDEEVVRVVTHMEGCNLSDPEDAETCFMVVDVRRPPDALRHGMDADGNPTVTLKTTLPGRGAVEITSTALRMVRRASNCLPYYGVSYELFSEGAPVGTPTIGIDVVSQGTIDGREVRELELECDAILVGSTSGGWWIP